MVQALRTTITGKFCCKASLILPGPGFPMKKSLSCME